MKNDSFVYIWKNLTDNKTYIGYHKGDVDDGYICSSKSDTFWDDFYNENKKWKREVIFEGSSDDCLKYEQNLLKDIDLNDESIYNNGRGAEVIFTDEVKGKMSLSHKERWDNMSEDKKLLHSQRISKAKTGVPRSEETKRKLSENLKGKTFVDRYGKERAKDIGRKISESNTGKHYHSEEWKQVLSENLKGNDYGKYQSEETRELKRKRWEGTKNPNSQKVLDIDKNIVHNTVQEAVDASGLCRASIWKHCNNKVKNPKWKYYGRAE